jgi:hypothetical protein
MTFLISGSKHARDMIFFWFAWLLFQFDDTTTSQEKEQFLFAVAQVMTLVRSHDFDVQDQASRTRIWFTCPLLPRTNKP